MKPQPCLLGAHFSIAKGLDNAVYTAQKYGCNALQLFTKNATTWKERELTRDDIDRFDLAREKTGITEIASHTSYLINLAAIEKKKYAMSKKALEKELIRSSMLGIPYVVLHPGAHMGSGETEGIKRIAETANEIFDAEPDITTRLLLVTTAGQGTSVGCRFEHLREILDRIENTEHIGVCLDTCHILAAGYDIRTLESYRKTMAAFDSIIGLNRLRFIHLNDSKKDLGSKVDRHEIIGRGLIGVDAFGYIMNDQRLCNIPKIIETPKGKDGTDWDRINLETLRKLIAP
jgi:deoxyribonuclease-4